MTRNSQRRKDWGDDLFVFERKQKKQKPSRRTDWGIEDHIYDERRNHRPKKKMRD